MILIFVHHHVQNHSIKTQLNLNAYWIVQPVHSGIIKLLQIHNVNATLTAQ
jgi:hypothetical protein